MTFVTMLSEIELQAQVAQAKFGRPPKLSCGDQVLMTLMYWREYRSQCRKLWAAQFDHNVLRNQYSVAPDG